MEPKAKCLSLSNVFKLAVDWKFGLRKLKRHGFFFVKEIEDESLISSINVDF